MPGYYAYSLGDGQSAKQLVDGYPVEPWQEARKVARFKPEKYAAFVGGLFRCLTAPQRAQFVNVASCSSRVW
jgi:hypothetical protein